MNFSSKSLVSAIVLSVALALGACGKKEAPPAPAPAPAPAAPAPEPLPPPAPAGVTVTAVNLGNAVDAAQNVTLPMESFDSKDTIYAAVSTNGSSASTSIAAKWAYQDGQVVNESSQTIAPTGPAVTTFHISKPDGWPVGVYSVDISVDGKVVDSKKFEVK